MESARPARMLRLHAGRHPRDRALSNLIGALLASWTAEGKTTGAPIA